MEVKIEKGGYVFYVDNYIHAEQALLALLEENKDHPVFEDYVKTG